MSFAPGDWGLPSDGASQLAAAVALLWCLAWGFGQWALRRRAPTATAVPARAWLPVLQRHALAAWALLAGGLSCAYFEYYLGGAPRIIDATSYWLQAHQFAAGQIALPADGPLGAFQGRFLVTPVTAAAGPAHNAALSVIFPPGYAALLAAGVLVGVPWLVGPALGVALVAATYALTRRFFESRQVALVAAGLSTLCATLRYHTADTMAHAWCALLVCAAMLCLFQAMDRCSAPGLQGRIRRQPTASTDTADQASTGVNPTTGVGRLGSMPATYAVLSGVCLGWLVATRPVSGLAAGLASVGLLWSRRFFRWELLAPVVLGALPGLTLLVIHQRLVTGEWFSSSQIHYYRLSDGPPGCFSYGFGANVGCRFEHSDFVAKYQPNGYGLVEALGTTGRRLAMHFRDAANWEPLALLGVLGLYRMRRTRSVRELAGFVLLWVVAYLPFYFDGNYPGGGARLFADILPLEHALLALGLTQLGLTRLAAPLALIGFAVHGHFDHRHLSERDGGRPMLPEPLSLDRAEFDEPTTPEGTGRRLFFVDTDHGFNLASAQAWADPTNKLSVARLREDAHDFALWQHQGKPPAAAYRFDFAKHGASDRWTRYQPEASARIHGGHLWPLLAATGVWAHPAVPDSRCARAADPDLDVTQSRLALRIHAVADNAASMHHLALALWTIPDELAASELTASELTASELTASGLTASQPAADGPLTIRYDFVSYWQSDTVQPLRLALFDSDGPVDVTQALVKQRDTNQINPIEESEREPATRCWAVRTSGRVHTGPLRLEVDLEPSGGQVDLLAIDVRPRHGNGPGQPPGAASER